jgi:geranylgeranyl diphosphate synthase type II
MGNHKKLFSRLYHQERNKIDRLLKNSFQNRKPSSLYDPGAYILSSKGKRIRPLLVLLSAKAVGGKFKRVYNASLAVEMLHNFTLVHDDIIDNADKRRGRLTLHKKYDINTAILTGDILLAVAYEYLLKDCNGNAKSVMNAFTKGLMEVCEGQSLDTDFESRNNVSINEYILMIKKKTAAMAEMCCRIGSILGGGNSRQINALSSFGLNLGIAFQIQDDLLDIIADENVFGKSIGGDLVEGKRTFLFIRALEKSKGDDKKKLLKVIINNGIRWSQVKSYKEIYIRLGVIDDAKDKIKYFSVKALKSLDRISTKNREIFYWLTEGLIKRTR